MKPVAPSWRWKDPFDAQFGVHTGEEIPLWHLTIRSPNAAAGVKHQAVPPKLFRAAVSKVPRSLSFIDLGCGKGRALILAHQAGFQKITGVEFSPELAAAARENVARVAVRAEVVDCDAAEFVFSGEPVAVFMNNPFDASVMKRVIEHLKARRSPAYVVYVSPTCENLFTGFFLIDSGADWKVWKQSEASSCKPNAA